MVTISGVEGGQSGLVSEREQCVAVRVSSRKDKTMGKWNLVEAFAVLSLGFLGGWALIVMQYSAANGLPVLAVAQSSFFAAVLGSVVAAVAGIGCFYATEGGIWTITRSGVSEMAAALSSLTISALGLHAALWLVG